MDIVTVVLIIFLGYFVVTKMLPPKGVKQVTAADIQGILPKVKQYELIDVRTPMEYKNGHIKEFKNIPLSELKSRINELSKDKEIIVICQSGMRSNNATRVIKKQGFESVTNVKGGMNSWRGSRV